ncbi:MAG: maltose alpha-D-glucosyltransferase [Cyclobacteriaceae bacterium]|nr:maltose alpha-D-glucosyltransferase [Cyclobacteriaceae bacterium]
MRVTNEALIHEELTWYKDAIIYELHIKAFFDSNNDGIGDFGGLIQKLDYLEELGVTTIWLLPFYPSPLRDDGYDIADYYNINPSYGSIRDFKKFLKEAHKKGLRVITELVLNHTSDEHEWFKKARNPAPGNPYRDYYVWSDTPEKYKDTRIIFTDYETSNWTWDGKAGAYFWHRFFSHQPDLNFENPRVQQEMFKIIDFWCKMGVDGFRLDAVPYLFEAEGTNNENLPQTHGFLKRLRKFIDDHYTGIMLLAEANMWPEDSASYFGNGDECHMNYHFPLMPRMFMALNMEDRYPIIEIINQTPKIPDNCQWANFLRNHDELTLEMVTDEERDYMYKVYTKDPLARINLGIRKRLAPLLENNRNKIELMNILLFSLPGTPVIYYGDEFGMGDNHYLGDRDGVRTPMQWDPGRNAGFSRANPQQLYLPVIIDPEYKYDSINVENQLINTNSLLWWMKRVIRMRKRYKAFGRGEIRFLEPANRKVLVFIREYKDEKILVVVNLSRFAQAVELDLEDLEGYMPLEVFSRNSFPVIHKSPYVVTLGPHGYYWFELKKTKERILVDEPVDFSTVLQVKKWDQLFRNNKKDILETQILPAYITKRRWFTGMHKGIESVNIYENIGVINGSEHYNMLLLEVRYFEGLPEFYFMPVSFATEKAERELIEYYPQSIICRVHWGEKTGILYDPLYAEHFRQYLLVLLTKNKRLDDSDSSIHFYSINNLRVLEEENNQELKTSKLIDSAESHTVIVYGNMLVLKMYRHLDYSSSRDVEISRFLSEKIKFDQVPEYFGTIEFIRSKSYPSTLGIAQHYIPGAITASEYLADGFQRYYENMASLGTRRKLPRLKGSLKNPASFDDLNLEGQKILGGAYLEHVLLLGQRTAEMHKALSSAQDERDFQFEEFTLHYQKSLYSGLKTLVRTAIRALEKKLGVFNLEVRKEVLDLFQYEEILEERFKRIAVSKLECMKLRIHGHYHLSRILFTGNDFIIIGFEGDLSFSYHSKKVKKAALRDLATLIYSIHRTAQTTAISNQYDSPYPIRWFHYISGFLIKSYIENTVGCEFIPTDRQQFNNLLEIFLLERGLNELNEELERAPENAVIPIRLIRYVCDQYLLKETEGGS